MYNNPIVYSDLLGNDPPEGGGDNPLNPSPGSGMNDYVREISGLGGGGSGTTSSSKDAWNATKALLEQTRQERAHKPTVQPSARRVITPQRNVSPGQAFHGGRNATTTPYSPPVEPVQLPVQNAHAPQLEDAPMRTFTTSACISVPPQGRETAHWSWDKLLDLLYGIADQTVVGLQFLARATPLGSTLDLFVDIPVYHLDGREATMTEQVMGGASVILMVAGGPILRSVLSAGGRILGPLVSRWSGGVSIFSRSAGTALEATAAAEVPVAVRTGAQLLDELGAAGASSADDMVTLYRGVNASHVGYQNALGGVVKPNRRWWKVWKLKATPLTHNTAQGGTLSSPYTSWTWNRDVAVNYALRPEGEGVLLTVQVPLRRLTASPDLKTVLLKQSSEIVPEGEMLIRGVVKNAQVTKISP